MSVVRMGEFRAKAGAEEQLREFVLTRVVPAIRSAEGNEGCHVLQHASDPSRLMVIETWVSVEAHKASVKQIPPGMIQEIMPLLGDSPAGDYYQPLET